MGINDILNIGDLNEATDEQLQQLVEIQKPEVFAKVFLDRELAWYQKKAIELAESNPFVGILLARQSGKTDAMAVLAVKKFILGRDEKILVIAPTENQAKNMLFARIVQLLNKSDFYDSCNFQAKRITKKDRKDGSFIEWLSASPTSKITGYTATFVILDESQDIEDNKLFNDIYPFTATTGASIVQIGTPRGKNHFWKIFQKESNYKTLDGITYKDVPIKKPGENKAGYAEGHIEKQKKEMPKEAFDMQYNCLWTEEKDMVFDYDAIAGCTVDLKKFKQGLANATYYVGVDFGQNPNYTVITIMRQNPVSQIFEVVYWESMQRDYTEVVSHIFELALNFNIEHMIVDRTSIGVPIWDMMVAAMDQLISRHNRDFNLEGLFFAPKIKLDMVDNLRVMMEQKQIYFPPFYVSELRSFRKQQLPLRGYRFYPETGAHDDRVDSLMMSAYTLKQYNKDVEAAPIDQDHAPFGFIDSDDVGTSEFVRDGNKWRKRKSERDSTNSVWIVDRI